MPGIHHISKLCRLSAMLAMAVMPLSHARAADEEPTEGGDAGAMPAEGEGPLEGALPDEPTAESPVYKANPLPQRQIGPANPYLDLTVPGAGYVSPKITEAVTPTEEVLAAPITQESLVDLIYMFNTDLQSRLPDEFPDMSDADQFNLMRDIMVEEGYPAILLGRDQGQVVDRQYFAWLLYQMLGAAGGQIDCAASLAATGQAPPAGPDGGAPELTPAEIETCFVNEGILPPEQTVITGAEIRDILGDPSLNWRLALDPGAADVLEPFVNSLEAVFLTPLSPTQPIGQ